MTRTLSGRLTIAIVLAPALFCWFTLRRGYSNQTRTMTIGYAAIVSAIMLSLIAFAVAGMEHRVQTAERTAVTAPKGADTRIVDASTLLSLYETDSARAKDLYADKALEVTGVVSSVPRMDDGEPLGIKFEGAGLHRLTAEFVQGQVVPRDIGTGSVATVTCRTIKAVKVPMIDVVVPILADCAYGKSQ